MEKYRSLPRGEKMRFLRTVLRLQCSKCIRKCFVLICTMSVAMVVFLHMFLPLEKPVFFSKNTGVSHGRNLTKYIYKYPGAQRILKSNYKILLWTAYFDDENWRLEELSSAFDNCEVSNCVLTNDKSDMNSSDALLFHTRDLNNIFPFTDYAFPNKRNSEQVWILLNHEPPVNDYIDYSKYNGIFNWTATYRQASDIHIPYGIVVKQISKGFVNDLADVKKTGVVWIASNCFDHARRQLLVQELQKYIHIDMFGFCGKGNKIPDEVEKKYKFYLSFENSNCDEYITEKFYNRVGKGILPVVFGAGKYKELAPPHSFIDIRDFQSAEEIAKYLKYLEKNESAYKEYFEWTKEYAIINYPNKWCRLCEALNVKKISHQVYKDLDGWIRDDVCHPLTLTEYASKYIDGLAAFYGIV